MRLVVVAVCLAAARVAAADDVAVWQDAELRVDPDAAATFHLAKLDGGRDAKHPATFAVHVIGPAARGKLVEVEPACGSALRGRGLAHLRLFVAKADFAGKPTRTDASCKDLAVAIDDSPLDDARDVIPAGTALATPSGRAVAIAAAPIAVTLIPGAKRVCVSRDVVLDGAGSSPIQVCAPARSVRPAGKHLGD